MNFVLGPLIHSIKCLLLSRQSGPSCCYIAQLYHKGKLMISLKKCKQFSKVTFFYLLSKTFCLSGIKRCDSAAVLHCS